MYAEAILRPQSLTGQKVYPADARRLIAKALDGKEVSPLLFCRDETGRTVGTRVNRMPPIPPVIFDGGTGFVRIYGIGELGKKTLTRDLGTIVSSLMETTGSTVTMELKEGEIKYKPSQDKTYRINKLGIGKKGKVRGEKFFDFWREYQEATDDSARKAVFAKTEPMIRQVLDWGMAAIADQLNFDLPKELDINIYGGELAMARIHPDKPGHIGIIRNLVFTISGEIQGPWSVGLLRSHGFGMIRKELAR